MITALLFALGAPGPLSGPTPDDLQVRGNSFSYSSNGLAGRLWLNKAAGTRLDLGFGTELELETGSSPETANKVELRVGGVETPIKGSRAVIHLVSGDRSLSAELTYQADPKWPILHKSVKVTNTGPTPVRLLNVVLGRFPVGKATVEGGERGFPLYLNGEFFVSLTHPAGFAHVEGKEVVLRQYPGAVLEPGQSFQSMEAVYGVAKKGEARKLFVDYVRSRMARVVYHHDKPYAILEAFGGQQEGDFKEYYARGVAEEYLHKHLLEVEKSRKESGTKFDFYGIEFWHNRAGDFTTFNKANFPNGFDRVKNQMLDLGMKPGLWIASSGTPDWTIDLNPAVRNCFNVSPGVGAFCRASEPLNQIYKDGFRWQMRENKVGLLKFDNLEQNCINPAHDHLPGPLYSTEAIHNAAIDFYQTLRRANPDVFIMLYWGYRSPWWLLYGDTYFECGDPIEAASPAQFPTPYARDSVTQRLDQAQLKITDTPWIGKDSLGVWLSNWTWNSGIGKARWQEGLIMDMARGGLLFQIWTDEKWLTPPERKQVATFLDLFKANGDCFDNSRFILGDPNRQELYGYSCGNGKRAFLAIHNACMKDSVVKVALGPELGLPQGRKWDVYRWHPRPARLTGQGLALAMRPYEVDLLEVVPAGGKPSLGRSFPVEAVQTAFSESTRELRVAVHAQPAQAEHAGNWTVLKPWRVSSAMGANLATLADSSILASGPNQDYDAYTIQAAAGASPITGLLLEMLPDDSLPGHGPGRAENGNFCLTNVRVLAISRGRPNEILEARIRSATADYSQLSFNGWPVAAAIDADPKTGWSIHPQVGREHVAVFTFDKPVLGYAPIVGLTGGERGHNLGRFRLSTTSDPTPALPLRYQPGAITVTGTLPPTKTGGLLLLEGGIQDDAPRALVGGKSVRLTPVWAPISNWPSPWQAWRAEIGPSNTPRPIEIQMQRMQIQAGTAFKARWLPK